VADSNDSAPKSIPQVASELWELSTAYAKQETIDPLRGLGRSLGRGAGGAVLCALGSVLLLLGLLRFLQTETDTALTGNLSWMPYLVVLVVAVALMGLFVWRVVKRKGPGL
jgi:uncharacterized membrane protein YidH (DUF202 family)